MTTQHTIIAEYPLAGADDGLPVEITYTYSPGRPAVRSLRNGDPGYPADPEEVEFVNVTAGSWSKGIVWGDEGIPPYLFAAIHNWACEWLDSDEGNSAACAKAFDDLQPDPDDARDRRDDARSGK